MSNPSRQGVTPILFSSIPLQVLTAIILFIALLYEQPGLVLLCLLLLIMFNGARLWCSYSLSGIAYNLVPARDKAFPGDELILKAETINNKILPVWVDLAVFVDQNLLSPVSGDTDPALNSPEHSSKTVTVQKVNLYGGGGLLWKSKASLDWTLHPQRRGVYETGPARLTAGDLFGFYRQEKYFSQTRTIIVYPRLINLKPFSMPQRELYGIPGSKSAVVDPVYPVATRDYREGSPARHIHWKASARLGRLQEKIFEPSVQQKTMLVVNVEGFIAEDAAELFEQTLEVVASLAVQLAQQGRIFGMISNGLLIGEKKTTYTAVLPPGKHASQLTRLLEMLARLQLQSGSVAISGLLPAAGLSRGITCLYFTCGQSRVDSSVRALLGRFKIPLVVITARGPVDDPDSGAVNIAELIGEGVAAE